MTSASNGQASKHVQQTRHSQNLQVVVGFKVGKTSRKFVGAEIPERSTPIMIVSMSMQWMGGILTNNKD